MIQGKYLPLLLFLCFFISHAQKAQTLDEFIEAQGLQADSPIASFKEEDADIRIVFGEEVEGPDSVRLWAFFDEQENQTEITYYNGSLENISGHNTYKYDEQGNQIENAYYRYDGSLATLTKYSYDTQDKMVEELQYYSFGTLMSRTEFIYDDAGNLLEALSYRPDDSLTSKTENKYDAQDNLIENTYEYFPEVVPVLATATVGRPVEGPLQEGQTRQSIQSIQPMQTTATTLTSPAIPCTTETTAPTFTTVPSTPVTAPFTTATQVATQLTAPIINTSPQFIAGAAPAVTNTVSANPYYASTSQTTYEYDDRGNMLKESRFATNGDFLSGSIYEYDEENNQIKDSFKHYSEDLNFTIEKTFDEHGNVLESSSYSNEGTLNSRISCSYEGFDKYDNWAKKTCFRYAELFGEVQVDVDRYGPEITLREIFYHTLVE